MKNSIKFYTIIIILLSGFLLLNVNITEADEKNKKPGRVTAVIPSDFPPTYFRDKSTGKPSGLAVDVLNELAKITGIEVDFVFAEPWKEIENSVIEGKADLIPFRVMSEKTLHDFIFTHELETTPINFIARSTYPLTFSEISGKTVGVIEGSTAFDLLKKRTDLKVVQVDGMQHLLIDLITGKIDLALTVTPNIKQLAEEAGLENRIKIIDPPLLEIKRGIALRRGNEELRDKFNHAIEKFHNDSGSHKIYEKWLGKPKPWWNTERVLITVSITIASLLLLFLIWRQLALGRFNRMINYEKKLLKTMIDAVPDLIFFKSRDLEYLGCNRAFAENFMGLKIEDIIGKNDIDLFEDKNIAEYFQKIDTDVINAGVISNSKQKIKMADGKSAVVETTAVPFKDNSGRVIGLIGISRDITVQEQNTLDLITARVEADSANLAKSQFLATMSHEIRTPMNGVIGMINLLLGTDLNSEQKEYAELVNRSGKNLLRLINDILDFSKIEAGKLQLEYNNFNIKDMIGGIIEIMSFQISKKNLNLISYIDSGVPESLYGDEGRLSQILINMIGNSVKFTENGNITINIQNEKETNSSVTLRFNIMDSGIGIPKEKIKNIFDPFIQADSTTTRKYGGTGLGLAISRQLVDLMGGTIGVESLEGKGSIFWFTVVLDKVKNQKTEITVKERPDIPPAADTDKKEFLILLVEDDSVNQLVAKTFIKKLGYSVDVAENGLEALKKLEKQDYNLVFMDCLMPEMDGYETTAAIRSQDSAVKNHNIPIIALTANALRGDMEKCLASGMNDYLAKPVESHLLKEAIEKWIYPRK